MYSLPPFFVVFIILCILLLLPLIISFYCTPLTPPPSPSSHIFSRHSTSEFAFTISLTHHHCTSVIVISILWVCLLWYAPIWLFYAACSTLLFLILSDFINLIHYYWSSPILIILIWLQYSVTPRFSPLSFTLIRYYHSPHLCMICSACSVSTLL